MTDLFTPEEPDEPKYKLDKRMIGPWIRCSNCGLTMADFHPKDDSGIAWAVKLERVGDKWVCTRCQ